MSNYKRVVIIGGGAGGMLVAANLSNARMSLQIDIVNSKKTFGTGVAYHPHSDSHLLNVVAGKMSAFPDLPNHFVQWLIDNQIYPDIEPEILANTFLPRRIYGEYLQWIWDQTKEKTSGSVELNEIINRATRIERIGQRFDVYFQDGQKISADFVVLATGNATPRNPPIVNQEFYKSTRYFNNPWLSTYAEKLDHKKDILIIGNGLTMVDVVQSLFEEHFKGTVHSISPNGFGILQHRHNGVAYGGLMRELKEKMSLHELVSLLNKHVKKVRRLGLSAEPIIDSLRPKTQSIWLSMSLEEKKKFMARLRHLWGVARHRLPIQVFDFIQRLKIDGKLKIWSGKIINITEVNDEITVEFFDKKSKAIRTLKVVRVINCTGPEVDLERMNDPLIKNLIQSGIIVPDALNLGLEADHRTLSVIDKNHKTVNSFFAIGGLLRGLLWESTAMPEIRVQAKLISEQIKAQAGE